MVEEMQALNEASRKGGISLVSSLNAASLWIYGFLMPNTQFSLTQQIIIEFLWNEFYCFALFIVFN